MNAPSSFTATTGAMPRGTRPPWWLMAATAIRAPRLAREFYELIWRAQPVAHAGSTHAVVILLMTGVVTWDPLCLPPTHTALRVFSGTHRYRKPAGLSPHSGLVAVVAGSSGKTQEGLGFNHPVHRRFAKGAAGGLRGLLQCGSLVIDINATLLDVRMLGEQGDVLDHFAIAKPMPVPTPP